MSGTNRCLDAMPFRSLTDYDLHLENASDRGVILNKLVNNGFKQFLDTYTRNGTDTLDPVNTCSYYDIDNFSNMYQNTDSQFSLFHMNLRRLGKHKGELIALLAALNHTFQVIVLTEIGHDANHFINNNLFPSYHHFYVLPHGNKYGGVAIFVHKEFGNVILRDDLKVSCSCQCNKCILENIWVQITNNDGNYIIGGLYRHPNGNHQHFTCDLESTLSKIDPNSICILAGDTNIDLLKYDADSSFNYFTTLSANNFLPCITMPTRITHTTATLIDHIFIKLPAKFYNTDVKSGNLVSDITDHLPNFVILNKGTRPKKNKRPMVRIYSEKNIDKFKNSLENVDWETILNYADIQNMCDSFYNHIYGTFETSFPLVRQSRARSKDKKWVTSGLLTSINKKNQLYRKQLSSPSLYNTTQYKNYKNTLSTCLKEAEKLYYRNLFLESNNAITTFWKTFGQTLNPSKQKTKQHIEKLIINNTEVTDNDGIANGLNDYFCTIGEKISNALPKSQLHFTDYLKNKLESTFFLSPITELETKKELKKLNKKKTSGPDNIPPKFINICSEYLSKPLTVIYNKSICDATFPNIWKLAKVIALYKKNDRSLPENYRPISLLNCFGKVFERLIYNQMIKFIEKHKILYINQFGFRKKFSTTLALIDTIEYIKTTLDNNQYVIGIFLDIRKAFDTVNHNIMCKKLEHYGFRGHSLNFLRSYLSDRTQYTDVNGSQSETQEITHGVPQGSILGPLLFLLYINDLHYAITTAQTRLFADDTSLLIKGQNIHTLKRDAEITLQEISSWFKVNKMCLSLNKSNFILFHGKRKPPHNDLSKLILGNDHIHRVKSTKYVGLIIDETLSWEDHINNLCKTLTKYFSVFYNIRNLIDNKLARTIYYACIHSRIKYGIEIYGSADENRLNKIQTLQNKLMKLLTRRDFLYSTDRLHAERNILKVKDIYETSLLHFTYNCINNNSIPNFKHFYKYQDNLYDHYTRHRKHITRNKIHTEIGRSSTHYASATLWNTLPPELTSIKTYHSFKRTLFKRYINRYS